MTQLWAMQYGNMRDLFLGCLYIFRCDPKQFDLIEIVVPLGEGAAEYQVMTICYDAGRLVPQWSMQILKDTDIVLFDENENNPAKTKRIKGDLS